MNLSVSNWLYIVSMIVSLVSIFVSNYLGQKVASKKFKREQELLRYNSLYVPLMNLLYDQEPDKYAFFNLLSLNRFEPFEDLMLNNVQFMGKESAEKFYKVIHEGKNAVIKRKNRTIELLKNGKKPEPLDKETSEAINLYKSLLIQLLSESEELAKELKLEPISKPLREALQQVQNL